MSHGEPAKQPILLETADLSLVALKLRLAAQVAPGRWRRALERTAEQVDAGKPLEVAARETAAPRELECLWREALSLPEPALFILDALRARNEVQANWRSFAASIGYPLAMLLFAVFIGVVFSFCMEGLVDLSGIKELDMAGFSRAEANLRDQQAALWGLALAVGWGALVLATIALVGPPWAWLAVVGGITFIGRPLRWLRLQEILHRFHLFAEQGAVDGGTGRAVARSFNSSSQSVVTESIANRIEAGSPVGRALAASMLSDGICRPGLLLLDEPGSDPTQCFLRTARLLGQLTEQHFRVLGTIIPIFLLLVVGTVVWATLNCYVMIFIPLIEMINSLA